MRHTAGDPGFVVDCTWQHYNGRHAHYLLPRAAELCLTLVLKDSGDLLELTYDEQCWRDDCTPAQVALTGPESTLRPGLHACQVGTLYGWSLGGRVPDRHEHNQHSCETLVWPDGREELWPGSAFVRTSNLTHDERYALGRVMRKVQEQEDVSPAYREKLLAALEALHCRPGTPPYVAPRVPFPDAGRLQEGEKYLLHRWLLKQEEQYHLVYGYPVWLVVAADESEARGWRVIKDNLCPRCGCEVASGAPPGAGEADHRYCRELRAQTGWWPEGRVK